MTICSGLWVNIITGHFTDATFAQLLQVITKKKSAARDIGKSKSYIHTTSVIPVYISQVLWVGGHFCNSGASKFCHMDSYNQRNRKNAISKPSRQA